MKKFTILPLLLAIVAVGFFVFTKDSKQKEQAAFVGSVASEPTYSATPESGQSNELKTFVFDNFHGSTDISDTFQFQYPANWYNEGQYFSPQKIRYYTKYEVLASVYFDLVLADIFDFTELKYQIDNSKRRTKDIIGKIGGKEFKRYDLIDYGTYGGESAGQVKIFVGPKITIDGLDYVLVFHWEERPLSEYMPGNDIEVFDNILLTLTFSH